MDITGRVGLCTASAGWGPRPSCASVSQSGIRLVGKASRGMDGGSFPSLGWAEQGPTTELGVTRHLPAPGMRVTGTPQGCDPWGSLPSLLTPPVPSPLPARQLCAGRGGSPCLLGPEGWRWRCQAVPIIPQGHTAAQGAEAGGRGPGLPLVGLTASPHLPAASPPRLMAPQRGGGRAGMGRGQAPTVAPTPATWFRPGSSWVSPSASLLNT